jgi:molybdopterin/thiamine biosynthesis adenylyltransferase
VGRPKVDALADFLRAMRPGLQVDALVTSVTHLRALNAVASADVVCSAPDHNGPRLAATYLASLFHRPLIDVGTAVLRDGAKREMGADIRLVWPGRCLLCTGGIRDEATARAVISSADAERELLTTPHDWRNERAGSLASLNGIAVCAAMLLISDFVAGRVRDNGTWLHFDISEAGRLISTYPSAVNADSRRTDTETPCACAFAGLGEDGLSRVVAALRRSSGERTTHA